MVDDVKEPEEKREPMGRYVYIVISAEVYIMSLRNECLMDKVVNPLPPDARFIRGGNDAIGRMYMVIESGLFDMLYLDDEIPFYGPIIFEKPKFSQGN